MKKELDDKLCEKFPKIFANRTKTKFESCFYWGFEHENGWYDLLDTLCTNIQNYLDKNLEVPQVVVDQVKEKFGTLSFYTSGGDEVTTAMEVEASKASSTICERCGSKNGVSSTKGWIKYLCRECMDKHNAEKT